MTFVLDVQEMWLFTPSNFVLKFTFTEKALPENLQRSLGIKS